MVKVAGILVLIAGVIFPMVMFGWLAARMNRKPPLAARRMGLILALNGVLPIALILTGFGMLTPAFWAVIWVRAAAFAALAAAVVILVFLAATRGRAAGAGGAPAGGPHGR